MDWKKFAIDRLIEYPIKKEALKNLKAQLVALEAKSVSLKGFVSDKIPTSGGGDMYSDKLLNIIVEMDELRIRYNVVRKQIAPIEDALATLTEDERWLVDTYVQGLKGLELETAMDARLHFGKTACYCKRTAALKKFTLLLYGVIED